MLRRVFGRRRRAHDIDVERLKIFDLPEEERPIEASAAWMPLGFANTFGMERGGFFTALPGNGAMGLSREQWFDPDESQERAALFGTSTALAHVVVLVTDRRLLWRPISPALLGIKDLAYPTYPIAALSQRDINLDQVLFAESVRSRHEISGLPGGLATSLYVRVAVHSEGTALRDGSFPVWHPQELETWTTVGDELQVWVGDEFEFIADLVAIALDFVGVDVRPTEWVDAAHRIRPGWKPMFERAQ